MLRNLEWCKLRGSTINSCLDSIFGIQVPKMKGYIMKTVHKSPLPTRPAFTADGFHRLLPPLTACPTAIHFQTWTDSLSPSYLSGGNHMDFHFFQEPLHSRPSWALLTPAKFYLFILGP